MLDHLVFGWAFLKWQLFPQRPDHDNTGPGGDQVNKDPTTSLGYDTTISAHAPDNDMGSLIFVPASPRFLLSHPGLSRDLRNIISRVAIQSARVGLLSQMHHGIFNLVQRHQAIEQDVTASLIWSEGVMPDDELAAYRTLVDLYYRHPRIFTIISTVHNDERMNAIEDTLTFNTEIACMRDVLDGSPGQIDTN